MRYLNRKILAYFAFFTTFLILSLLAHLPASFVLNPFLTIKGLSISNPQGTIWKGSVSQLRWNDQRYGELSWDIQFTKLLQAKLETAVQLKRNNNQGISAKGFIGIGFSGIYTHQLIVSLPASRLTPFIKAPLPVNLNGQLELTIKQAQYAAPWCKSAQGSLVWEQGQLGLPIGALELSTTIIDFDCKESKISASGQQQTAQISSAFSAQLDPINPKATTIVTKGIYNTQLWFKPEAEFPITMQSQLGWLGNPDAQGRYQFNYQGKF